MTDKRYSNLWITSFDSAAREARVANCVDVCGKSPYIG
jgi:hypothetical protein